MREVTLHTDKPSSIIHSAPNSPRPYCTVVLQAYTYGQKRLLSPSRCYHIFTPSLKCERTCNEGAWLECDLGVRQTKIPPADIKSSPDWMSQLEER